MDANAETTVRRQLRESHRALKLASQDNQAPRLVALSDNVARTLERSQLPLQLAMNAERMLAPFGGRKGVAQLFGLNGVGHQSPTPWFDLTKYESPITKLSGFALPTPPAFYALAGLADGSGVATLSNLGMAIGRRPRPLLSDLGFITERNAFLTDTLASLGMALRDRERMLSNFATGFGLPATPPSFFELSQQASAWETAVLGREPVLAGVSLDLPPLSSAVMAVESLRRVLDQFGTDDGAVDVVGKRESRFRHMSGDQRRQLISVIGTASVALVDLLSTLENSYGLTVTEKTGELIFALLAVRWMIQSLGSKND